MQILMHSAIRIENVVLEGEARHRANSLGGGADVERAVAQGRPHGISRCYLGVGGYFCENARHRGFMGQMPSVPNIVSPDHVETYIEEIERMRAFYAEDLVIAASVGVLAGAMAGLCAGGVAYVFGAELGMAALPTSLMVPCGLATWALYRGALNKKMSRIESLLKMAEGLAHPTEGRTWREAQEVAVAHRGGDDPLLAHAARQFFSAKDEILPRYEELGIVLPAYAPPDEDTPLGVVQGLRPPP